jgi:hypothetical protein
VVEQKTLQVQLRYSGNQAMNGKTMELERIKRYGRVLKRITLAFMLLTPVVVAWLVLRHDPLALVTLPPGIEVDRSALTLGASLAIVAVGLLTPATYLVGLVFLYRLFDLYAQGIVFSHGNVAAIRRSGYVLVAIDFVRILQSALTGPVLTAIGAVHGYVTVGIGFSMVVVGLAVVLISHVMDLGCKIYERDRLTI